MWRKEQESDANQPCNPEDPSGWYIQQNLKASLLCVMFISSNVLLFDTIVIMLSQIKLKEILHFQGGNSASSLVVGEWRMMLAEENLHLKFGRCCLRCLP